MIIIHILFYSACRTLKWLHLIGLAYFTDYRHDRLVSVNKYNLATRVVEIIPYLYHLSCHLSKLVINGLYSFFKDSLSLNKSVLVVDLYLYICIVHVSNKMTKDHHKVYCC